MDAPASASQPAAPDSRTRLKVILLGDSGAGKTSLVNRYVDESFTSEFKSTSVDSLHRKDIVIEETPVTLEIWDILGQESSQNLGKYYAWLDGCILVYDVNCKKSFESLDKWRSKVLQQLDPSRRLHFPFLLLGNKVDINPAVTREVSKESAMAWCDTKGNIPFFETSTKENYNIDHAFLSIAKAALTANAEQKLVFPAESPGAEKGGGCSLFWI